MKVKFLLTVIVLATLNVHGQLIDKDKSGVTFTILERKDKKTVNGSFGGMKGEVNFKPADLENSSFNVCISANTVDTGLKLRDKQLNKDEFFHTEVYPNICFASSRIFKTTEGYVTRGVLSIHEISREVEIPFTFENNTFRGSLSLDRLDYKLGEKFTPKKMALMAKVEIVCVLK
jgi:polyisoprenoid-binding protein YceI